MAYQTQGYGDTQPFVQGGGGGPYGNDPHGGPNYSQGGYGPGPGDWNNSNNYPGYNNPGGLPPAAGAPGGNRLSATSDWSVGFFMAGCSIMIGAFIGGIALFFSFELVDFLEMAYLFIFGAVLAVLDTPCFKAMKTIKDHREYFSKYIHLLTRVTGKGITYLFLGCSLFSGMWDNLEGYGLLFLAFVLCILPVVVGIAALVVGFMKSQKLNKARQFMAQDDANLNMIYDQYARTFPGAHGGLTMAEFSDLTNKIGGIKWEEADTKLIFNALVSNPAWRPSNVNPTGYTGQPEMAKLPKEDLLEWVKGGMVWL